MKPGEEIQIKATVLRVDGCLVHAQTPSGQLIQTDRVNVETKPAFLPEHKAILNAPENKNIHRRKNR